MKYIVIILLTIVMFTGCDNTQKGYMPIPEFTDNSKPVSYGNHQDVYLFSNQEQSNDIRNLMKKEFGFPLEGAQKEKTFELLWKRFQDFEEFKKAKNVMFICNLGIQDSFTSFVRSKIPRDKLDGVINGSSTIITYQNEWSDDQLVTFILAQDENSLENIILARSTNLYQDFAKRFLNRMTRRVYYRGTLKGNEFQDYPYSLKIPSTFQVYKEDKSQNMISFIHRYKKKDTTLPDKFFSIYMEKMDEGELTEEWVKNVRKEIGTKILDGDEIDWMRTKMLAKTFTTWDNINYYGYILEGAWENDSTKMGGSFKSYAFYDRQTKAGYFIDTAVYYPAGTKVPYLAELEGIAKSFNIKEQK
ncbi:DUF4837 family protein [bacterium]|nr:DUF4837 family protein [bacterium]